jgi:glycosyltransferase involved in cell wall biosynthesis
MKVGIINPFPISSHSGIEVVTSYLVTELEKKGVETEIAFLPDSTTRFTTKSLRILISVFLYRELMKMKGKVDIIHANSWCSWLLRFVKEKPNLAACHGSVHDYLQAMNGDAAISSRVYSNIVTMRLERMGYWSAKHDVAVSNATKRDMALNYGIPEEKITVIHNGIPAERFARVKSRLKDRLGCDMLLFAVGRLAKQKGFEYLIRAAPLLNKKDFKLVIAGSGPERENLLSLIKQLGVEDRVSLVGAISEREKREFFSSADVFLCPSIWESFGMILLEAMACKTPIVATRVASIPEVVGDCGILVKPRAPEELAAGIGKLLDDKNYAKRLAQKAYNRLNQNFSSEKMASSYINVYEKIINEK